MCSSELPDAGESGITLTSNLPELSGVLANFLNSFYGFFASLGYEHPIHPAIVHLPIGAVIAAWFFLVLGILRNHDGLRRSAYYCSVFALLFAIPTVMIGFADWQHFLAGATTQPITLKLWFASILIVSLSLIVILGYRKKDAKALGRVMLLPATVNMALVIGLGFEGGNLVYGGKQPDAPRQYQAGATVFKNNCSGCHAGGGNVIKPNLPLLGASQLQSEATFQKFIRAPHMPGGDQGPMPGFSPSKLSNDEATELYNYITMVLADPRGSKASGSD